MDVRASRAVRTAGRWFGLALRWTLYGIGAYLALGILLLVLYRFVWPPLTGVQAQRLIEAIVSGERATFHWTRLPVERIDSDLPHAVVAAEDARFYRHHGIDPQAVHEAIEDTRAGRRRGGSTITQQLVKNLLMTTHGGWLRKGFEVPLALVADLVLGKERQLELYLNVVEWGPGIYGAEEAARYHLGKSAGSLSRSEAAGLASLLPAPRTRTISGAAWYRSIILRRMDQMGY